MMIRPVQLRDATAIRAIYQPYVTETAITFEVDVPTVQEFESRITKTLTQFPYLVAEVDGKVVGMPMPRPIMHALPMIGPLNYLFM